MKTDQTFEELGDQLEASAKDNRGKVQPGGLYDRDVYTLTVDTSNAAFDGPEGRHELAEVLVEAAGRVRRADFAGMGHPEGWKTNYPNIHQDINGNTVAHATFTSEQERDSIPVDLAADALAAALAVFLLDSVTRATLDAIDPQAVKQAVEAMGEFGGRKGKFIANFTPTGTLRAAIDERITEAQEVTEKRLEDYDLEE